MRKIRHPYQILEAEELIVGEKYAFISRYSREDPDIDSLIFGGIIKEDNLVIDNPPQTTPFTFTIHPSGLQSDLKTNKRGSTIVYWLDSYPRYDLLSTFLGEIDGSMHKHSIVVTLKHWDNDPKMHVLDWVNPDDIIKRFCVQNHDIETPAEFEKRMRQKKHDAMREMLGF